MTRHGFFIKRPFQVERWFTQDRWVEPGARGDTRAQRFGSSPAYQIAVMKSHVIADDLSTRRQRAVGLLETVGGLFTGFHAGQGELFAAHWQTIGIEHLNQEQS